MNLLRALALLLILMISFGSVSAVPMPKLDIGLGGHCVENPGYMRQNHMHMLKHQRDETVRQGIRGGKFSLSECVNCHASKPDDNVLGGSAHFCQGCHEYAAVKIDCFECHSSKRKIIVGVGK